MTTWVKRTDSSPAISRFASAAVATAVMLRGTSEGRVISMCWTVASRLCICGQMMRMEYMGGRTATACCGDGWLEREIFGWLGVGVKECGIDEDDDDRSSLSAGISSFICVRSCPLALAASLKRARPATALTEDIDERAVTCETAELIDGSELPLDAMPGDAVSGTSMPGLTALLEGLTSLAEACLPGESLALISEGSLISCVVDSISESIGAMGTSA